MKYYNGIINIKNDYFEPIDLIQCEWSVLFIKYEELSEMEW